MSNHRTPEEVARQTATTLLNMPIRTVGFRGPPLPRAPIRRDRRLISIISPSGIIRDPHRPAQPVMPTSDLTELFGRVDRLPSTPPWRTLLRRDPSHGTQLRQAYGVKAKGGSIERFMKQFEAECLLAESTRNRAVMALEDFMKGVPPTHGEKRQYLHTLWHSHQRFEKCREMLLKQREHLEASSKNWCRGGADVEEWFREKEEEVETGLKRVRGALRAAGVLVRR